MKRKKGLSCIVGSLLFICSIAFAAGKELPELRIVVDFKEDGTTDEALKKQAAAKLVDIPAGTYLISKYLSRYVSYLVKDRVRIDSPFSIQAAEVTVGEFREFVRETQLDAGLWWEKDRQTEKLYPDERPLENVSWEEASRYAAWLSHKTGWNFRLPTIEQWTAACVMFAEEKPNLDQGGPILPQKKVDHLLGNLREWSSDDCTIRAGKNEVLIKGRFALGENYWTDTADPEAIGSGNCVKEKSRWTGLGFRLVRIEQ